jgi:uncharacterized membrane protein YkvA (DUF1232 family)
MQNYDGFYSEQDFWAKIKTFALKMGEEILEKALWLYYVLQTPDVPVRIKALIYSALGYLILPLDLIPDTIPVVGFSDDLIVLSSAVAAAALYITPEIKRKTREQLDNWFG